MRSASPPLSAIATSDDLRGAVEQPRQVLERGSLVVDGQDPQARAVAHAARTPARNFGTVIVTVVPRPSRESISRP